MEPPGSGGQPLGAGPTQVVIVDKAWRRMAPNAERVARRAAREAGGVGTVVLESDHAVKRLNARYRGRNKATNVLTFEGGDVFLAAGVVRREAAQAGRRVAHVLAHLVVHGALHLRGEDHGLAGDARRMELLEARILQRLGVPNPWRRA